MGDRGTDETRSVARGAIPISGYPGSRAGPRSPGAFPHSPVGPIAKYFQALPWL